MARRDNTDPDGTRRLSRTGRFAWPANRRILYNRASADPQGKPWDPSAASCIEWNGAQVGRLRRARHRADRHAGASVGPFIMNPEGVAAPVRPRA